MLDSVINTLRGKNVSDDDLTHMFQQFFSIERQTTLDVFFAANLIRLYTLCLMALFFVDCRFKNGKRGSQEANRIS